MDETSQDRLLEECERGRGREKRESRSESESEGKDEEIAILYEGGSGKTKSVYIRTCPMSSFFLVSFSNLLRTFAHFSIDSLTIAIDS